MNELPFLDKTWGNYKMIIPNTAKYVINDSKTIRHIVELMFVWFCVLCSASIFQSRYVMASVFGILMGVCLLFVMIIDKCHAEVEYPYYEDGNETLQQTQKTP